MSGYELAKDIADFNNKNVKDIENSNEAKDRIQELMKELSDAKARIEDLEFAIATAVDRLEDHYHETIYGPQDYSCEVCMVADCELCDVLAQLSNTLEAVEEE